MITCEEVFELRLGLPDVVAMQTRQPNLEGFREIRLRRLVKEALRMRPDRLMGYRYARRADASRQYRLGAATPKSPWAIALVDLEKRGGRVSSPERFVASTMPLSLCRH